MIDVTTNESIISDDTIEFGPAVKMGSVLHMWEQSAAPTEISGYGVLYTKASDGRLYYKTDAGVEYTVGPASGDVRSVHSGLDLKTDEIEVSAALDGVATMNFVPFGIVLQVAATAGALNADGTVNVGTTTDGAEISSALALTGLTAVGATRYVPLAANTASILGNATLYVNVEAAETGAGTLSLDVYVLGRQF